jgi:hypothetical protein
LNRCQEKFMSKEIPFLLYGITEGFANLKRSGELFISGGVVGLSRWSSSKSSEGVFGNIQT